ncbi:Non-specific serine/threonine protein kinase [Bertholletia excelsa]
MSIPVFLLWLVSIPLIIHAAVPLPSKAILLSCGSAGETKDGGLTYLPDDAFITIGNKSTLNQPDLHPTLSALRYFPDASARKYCYVLPAVKGGRYLVKTTYFFGGLNGAKEPPVFYQIIDGMRWSIVNTTEDYAKGLSSYYEVVVQAQGRTLSLCLARSEPSAGDPFISTIEMHNLDSSVYNSTDFSKYALATVARSSFGSNGDIVGFPEDPFNRFWQPFTDANPAVETRSNITPSDFWNLPPAKALSSAITTSKGKTLSLKWPPFPLPKTDYYVALYFQDNRGPSPFSWRVFNVSVNGKQFYAEVNVSTSGVTIYSAQWPLAGETEIALTPSGETSVGPLINAGEIFQIVSIGGRTHTRDVSALEKLKKRFTNPPADWNGDPCLPEGNSWTGVTCSSKGKYARVTALNLTGMGIAGSLFHTVDRLSALNTLWLGRNKLSGQLPNMGGLKSLQTLHLEGNQFQGPIPESLGQLPQLREVFLQDNNLSGIIPESLKKPGLDLRVSPGNHLS